MYIRLEPVNYFYFAISKAREEISLRLAVDEVPTLKDLEVKVSLTVEIHFSYVSQLLSLKCH